MKKTLLAIMTTGLLLPFVGTTASGQDAYFELLRSDLRTQKIALLTEALPLSNEEANAFWPIHRQYEAELSGIGDRRIALLKRYVENFETFDDDQAREIARDWFKVQKSRLALLEKYHKKIAKELSPRLAAQFVQLENQIGLLIDLQLAAETPLIQ